MTKVLLLKSFHGLGSVGDIVTVKPGYAKNFLIPANIALFVNKNILAQFENRKSEFIENDRLNKEFVTSISLTLKSLEILIFKRSFSDGKLFGSVSTREICDEILKNTTSLIPGVDIKKVQKFINPANIRLFSNIKYIGEYNAKVVLYGDVSLDVAIKVKSDIAIEENLM